MHSIAEAQETVLRHAQPLAPTRVPLDATAVDLILAEDIASDIDSPPYAKALMDGYEPGMTTAEVSVPIRIPYCRYLGVAPTM